MKEIFKSIPTIEYEGRNSKNALAFHYYDKDEVILGKKMSEHLRFAMSWWHTLCGDGSDMFGAGSYTGRNFGGGDIMTEYKTKAVAAFELMNKLGIDFFCFHDRDIAPEGENLAISNERLDVMTEFIAELMKENPHKRLLWGTANCFSNPRYMQGAATAPEPAVFAFAAAQIKKAIEITHRLKGQGYVFWGGREGYETLLNTDMAIEQDNMARLMGMAVQYGRSIGFTGDFYIEPKPCEPMKHQYDFDVATVLGFLRKYRLDKDFKMNIEANHATLAGHTFAHELHTARINGVFGSIDANKGDLMLGWDTDQFPTCLYDTTLCMLEVLRAGGFTNGGLNFDAKVRRASFEPLDIAYSYIAGMDSFAFGLRAAARIIEDGRIDKFVKDRYINWTKGLGAQITSGAATMQSLEEFALKRGDVLDTLSSGAQEYLERILNSVIIG